MQSSQRPPLQPAEAVRSGVQDINRAAALLVPVENLEQNWDRLMDAEALIKGGSRLRQGHPRQRAGFRRRVGMEHREFARIEVGEGLSHKAQECRHARNADAAATV